MTEIFQLQSGAGPLLISVPHAGQYIPPELQVRMTSAGRSVPDTDWFVDRLYAPALESGAGLIVASHSRYVADLNRPPDDAALYATPTPGLLPLETFSGEPIYTVQGKPTEEERRARLDVYWRPYHVALEAELRRIRELHGHVVLLEAHSIRSRVPALFDGRLPDLNLGSFDGASAAPGLVAAAMGVLSAAHGYSAVLDGRFKGGFITRHYGQPAHGVHALQLEMSQAVYMQEVPPQWLPAKAQRTQEILQRLVNCLLEWKPKND